MMVQCNIWKTKINLQKYAWNWLFNALAKEIRNGSSSQLQTRLEIVVQQIWRRDWRCVVQCKLQNWLGIFVLSSKLSLQKTFEIVVLMPIADRLEIVVQCNGMAKDRLKVREKPPSSFLTHELPWDCRIMHHLPSTRTHQEQKWTWAAEESKRKIDIQTGQWQCVRGKQGFKEAIGCCCLSSLALSSILPSFLQAFKP